jgi:hypothetical protein
VLVNCSQTRVQKVALHMLRALVLSLASGQQLKASLHWALYTLVQVCNKLAEIKSLLQSKDEVSFYCTFHCFNTCVTLTVFSMIQQIL